MRRVQESVGYTGKYRNRTVRSDDGEGEGTNAKRLALFLVVVGLVMPLVTQMGSLLWAGHWAVRIALLITSIVLMTKGAPFRGCLGILLALIVLPLWLVLAPLSYQMATDERGWKQVLQEEIQKYRAQQDGASTPETEEVPEGMQGSPALPSPEPEFGLVETITSKDGRTIRGTIEVYEAWGVMMKRDDGQIVNVSFDLMSAEDMKKFRGRYHESTR